MYKIIIISLERAPHRREAMIEQLDRLGLDYDMFPAFDAKGILNAQFTFPILKGAGIGRKLQAAEICCTLSHIAALKHAKVMGYENVVVLEDDVVMCSDWERRIEILFSQLPENWDYVYLSGHSDYVYLRPVDTPTVYAAPVMVSSFSYMVSKSGIDKVIDLAMEMTTTYDDMITHKIKSGRLNGYLYMPFVTYHAAQESYIWGETAKEHSSKKLFKDRIDD